jgi:23S rRNA pseudouridine2457 synthase
MPRLILLNKPYGVLCQFTAPGNRRCLKDYIDVPLVYPAGRLDHDSEGLVVLTDDGALQARISEPRHKMSKVYWAQVEGEPDGEALDRLQCGVELGDFRTRPCAAELSSEPPWLWQRMPPIRVRKNIPVSWLKIELTEGRNRQVRRMTAAIGHPTLRLLRERVGPWSIAGLAPGAWQDAPSDPGEVTVNPP